MGFGRSIVGIFLRDKMSAFGFGGGANMNLNFSLWVSVISNNGVSFVFTTNYSEWCTNLILSGIFPQSFLAPVRGAAIFDLNPHIYQHVSREGEKCIRIPTPWNFTLSNQPNEWWYHIHYPQKDRFQVHVSLSRWTSIDLHKPKGRILCVQGHSIHNEGCHLNKDLQLLTNNSPAKGWQKQSKMRPKIHSLVQ